MFAFNRPLSAVAAGLGVALLIVCLDGLSHPLEALHEALQRVSPSVTRWHLPRKGSQGSTEVAADFASPTLSALRL